MRRFKNWRDVLRENLAALGYHSYGEYLMSPHWKSVRRMFYASKVYRRSPGCFACGDTDKPLEVHHKSYKHLGCERIMDLAALCRECHQQTHDIVGSTSRTNIWNACKKVKKSICNGSASLKSRPAGEPKGRQSSARPMPVWTPASLASRHSIASAPATPDSQRTRPGFSTPTEQDDTALRAEVTASSQG